MPLDTSSTTPTGANHSEYFAMLCSELPPVPGEDPPSRAARQKSAMDAIVALNPDNAFEARLAVRIVAADDHAADALRSAALALAADDPEKVRQCRAQAASMARQSDAALRALMRIQARREKLVAAMHPAAMEQAGYWFKSIAAPPTPSHAPAEAPPPADAEPVRTHAGIDADAELYAIMYPDRAARIRDAGGLPGRLDFGPPEPEIVAALLRTRAPAQAAAETGSAGERNSRKPIQ